MFRDDEDRVRFLAVVGEACGRFGLAVHGYCLMGNHYHLLTGTPRGNLSRAVGWLQVTYTVRFNRRHRRCGHLFQGRFKAQLIDADAYARHLVRYVHLNPVRPRDRRSPCRRSGGEVFEGYRWSSHRAYAGTAARGEAPEWLSLEWLSYWHEAAGAGAAAGRGGRTAATWPAASAGPPTAPGRACGAGWCWAGRTCGRRPRRSCGGRGRAGVTEPSRGGCAATGRRGAACGGGAGGGRGGQAGAAVGAGVAGRRAADGPGAGVRLRRRQRRAAGGEAAGGEGQGRRRPPPHAPPPAGRRDRSRGHDMQGGECQTF